MRDDVKVKEACLMVIPMARSTVDRIVFGDVQTAARRCVVSMWFLNFRPQIEMSSPFNALFMS
jgi:hypothetical protein